jgi:hypothetical protein
MEVGGTFCGKVIAKINKSNVTGRVVSVHVIGAKVNGWVYKASNVPGTEFALHQFDTERADPDAYQPPTEESRAKLAAFEQARKDYAKQRKATVPACPLINPTDADAERLQAVWNEQRNKRIYDEPKQVERMTQAQYSEWSRGTYGSCETVEIIGGGFVRGDGGHMRRPLFPAVAKVRKHGGSVVVLTDKPQKKMTAEMWHDPKPEAIAEVEANFLVLLEACKHGWSRDMTLDEREVFDKARRVRLAYEDSLSQFGLTEAGIEMRKRLESKELVNA